MNVHWLNVTDSTNLEAWRNKESAPDRTVWIARFQREGRGQRGNIWESAAGENLTFSILFRPTWLPVSREFEISILCSLGLVNYLADKGLQASIKWPNDIYVKNRKICGMLLEHSLNGDRLAVSIAGIGLNLNQRVFSPALPNPTSLLIELADSTACPFIPEKELDLLLTEIFRLYDKLATGSSDPEEMYRQYEALLYRLGTEAEFEETAYFTGGEERRFRGRILGIDRNSGRLRVLKTQGNRISEYYFKEIRYILDPSETH